MNLTWHLVGRDVRMLKSRWAVWLAIVAAKLALGVHLVRNAALDGVDFAVLQAGVLAFAATDGALTFLMTGLLVHADAVAGSNSAWMTRPISGWRLLRTKCISLLLLLVLPAALGPVPWWMTCGLSTRQIAIAAVEAAILQLLIIAPAMAVASLTRTLAQFLVWSVGAALGTGALVAFTSRGLAALAPRASSGAGMMTPLVGFWLLAVIASVVPIHYVRRDVRLAVKLLAGGLIGAVLLAYATNWVVSGVAYASMQARQKPPVDALPVSLEFRDAGAAQRSLRISAPDSLNLRYEVHGLLPTQMISRGHAEHHWEFENGNHVRQRSTLYGGSSARIASSATKGEVTSTRRMVVLAHVSMSTAEVRALAQAPSKYSGQLDFDIIESRAGADIPFQEGIWHAREGRGARILRIEPKGRERTVRLVESAPFSVGDEITMVMRKHATMNRSDFFYVLHNTAGNLSETHQGQTMPGFILSGVQVRPRTVMFAGMRAGGDAAKDWDRRDAFQVAIVEPVLVATVRREVKVGHFEVAK